MNEKIKSLIFNVMGVSSLLNLLSNAIYISLKGEVAHTDSILATFFPVTVTIAIVYSMWLGMKMEQRKTKK